MEKFLKQCKSYFIHAAFFSLFINLLMLTLPLYMLQVFDRVITSRSGETLLMLTLAAVFAFMAHGALEILRSRLLLGAGIALDALAGPPVLTGVLASAARGGENSYVSGLRDVAIVRAFLTGSGINALFDSPWVPIYLTVIFVFHPVLGVLATLGAATLFVLAYLNEKFTRAPLDEMSRASRRAGRYIDAGIRNAEVVSALGMLASLNRRWQKLNGKVIDANVIASVRGSYFSGLTRFLRMLLQILMLGVGAMLVIRQHVSPGIMIAGTLILSRALSPVETAIHTWKGFVEARDSYWRLQQLLAEAPAPEKSTELPPPSGQLEVERVIYTFPGQDRPVIKGVSFRLAAGESLGLIGPSAAGKSTLARLLIGIWRPQSGAVRLDGADVSVWPRYSLGPNIGYLPQDVELFSGTVGENIARLGTASDVSIIEAAQRAHAHEMIMRLPRAYDTEIGESGAQLSAGQRQRIGLARALFGRPRFVVLDEPNSNLDHEGEEALARTLRELAAEKVTVVTISHRPSILAHADKLCVLRDGQVELFGPRAEVTARMAARAPQPAEPPAPVALAGRQT
jgi:PrtD family type I secretion system ABC transporter